MSVDKCAAVDLQEVVGPHEQLPLAVCGGLAPAHEPSGTPGVFDLAEDRLDDVLSLLGPEDVSNVVEVR
jgi:hypothetical protein